MQRLRPIRIGVELGVQCLEALIFFVFLEIGLTDREPAKICFPFPLWFVGCWRRLRSIAYAHATTANWQPTAQLTAEINVRNLRVALAQSQRSEECASAAAFGWQTLDCSDMNRRPCDRGGSAGRLGPPRRTTPTLAWILFGSTWQKFWRSRLFVRIDVWIINIISPGTLFHG
jgi:hypothetical protein